MTTYSTRFANCRILLTVTSLSSDTPTIVCSSACIMHSALHLMEGTRKHYWLVAGLVLEPFELRLFHKRASSVDVPLLVELFQTPSTLSGFRAQPSCSHFLTSCSAFLPQLAPLQLLSAPYCGCTTLMSLFGISYSRSRAVAYGASLQVLYLAR
jgi:hypothetical protein